MVIIFIILVLSGIFYLTFKMNSSAKMRMLNTFLVTLLLFSIIWGLALFIEQIPRYNATIEAIKLFEIKAYCCVLVFASSLFSIIYLNK